MEGPGDGQGQSSCCCCEDDQDAHAVGVEPRHVAAALPGLSFVASGWDVLGLSLPGACV